ncbi:MAG: YbaK/EbsC family protein [Myxococcota bacterium]
MSDVGARILAALKTAALDVRDHAPASSAVEAAALRGTALSDGCKAIVMKLGKDFAVLAFSADRSIDNRKLRQRLRVRRYRFATEDELAALTGGLVPGSIPPFGRPIFDLPLYADATRAATEWMWFTNASRSQSVRVSVAGWLAVAQPVDVFDFTRAPVREG